MGRQDKVLSMTINYWPDLQLLPFSRRFGRENRSGSDGNIITTGSQRRDPLVTSTRGHPEKVTEDDNWHNPRLSPEKETSK